MSGVVFAQALEKLQQVENVRYKINTTVDGEFFEEMPEANRSTKMEMLVMVSDAYGMKMETFI